MSKTKTPFFRLSLQADNRDLSQYIKSVRIEESVSKLDLITLTIYDATLSLIDEDALSEGKVVEYMFGYLGGDGSPRRYGKIVGCEPNYDRELTLTLKISDLGIDLKKGTRNRVFQKKTAADIARQIASERGLEAEVDDTSHQYEMLAQGNKSDYELLQHLSEQEEDGEIIFYTREHTLCFKRLALEQPSQVTYTWRGTENKNLSFRPVSNAVTKEMASESAQTLSDAVGQGVQLSQQVNEQTVPADQKLGGFVYTYNANGERVGQKPLPPDKQVIQSGAMTNPLEEASGKTLFSPASSQKITENIAAKLKKKQQLRDMTATLSMEGEPLRRVDTVLTMAGVARRHLGNWYVAEIIHEMSVGSSFRSNLKLWKNAGEKTTATPEAPVAQKTPAPVNTTIGEAPGAPAKVEVKRRLFNADGQAL